MDDATMSRFPAYAQRRGPEAGQDLAELVEDAAGRTSGQGAIRPVKAAI